jgi:cell division protein FtsX
MVRIPFASLTVVFVFTMLFTTLSIGVTMLRFLDQERATLESRFTYPLALDPLYTFESERVYDFAESLVSIGLSRPLEYISREQALDREIQRNPNITQVLSGENPLPDTIIIPLTGIDTDMLWRRIREFRDLFESDADVSQLRIRLERFENSLQEMEHIWTAILIFIGLTLTLMTIVLVAILRYHLRLFQSERIVGRIVGADPVYIWWPHVITMLFYISVSTACALGLFQVFQQFYH